MLVQGASFPGSKQNSAVLQLLKKDKSKVTQRSRASDLQLMFAEGSVNENDHEAAKMTTNRS